MLNRRNALYGFAFVLGASTAGLTVHAAAAPLPWTPTALDASQAAVLDTVAELIMPPTKTPGAREVGVPAFVDRALKTYCDAEQAAAIRQGLSRIDAEARTAHGKAFPALTEPQQVALLTRLDREAVASPTPGRHFFRALKELVTLGYFTSKPGATVALRYDPLPGDYKGCIPFSQVGRAWAI